MLAEQGRRGPPSARQDAGASVLYFCTSKASNRQFCTFVPVKLVGPPSARQDAGASVLYFCSSKASKLSTCLARVCL
jgi:ribosomal protein L24E